MTTWRHVQILYLPGDEPIYQLMRVTNRDARLTGYEELVRRRTWACCHNKRNYRRWQCSSEDPCVYCTEVKKLTT